jgi:hypothetical protein
MDSLFYVQFLVALKVKVSENPQQTSLLPSLSVQLLPFVSNK